MTERLWLKSYPDGMPADIDPDQYPSIAEMFAQCAQRFADRPAFDCLGHVVTYAEVDRMVTQFAAYLQNLPGMAQGARVAVMSPNLLQFPVALLGILRAGMVAVNVNPLYTARELEHQLKDAGVQVIVVVENFAHVVQEALPHTQVKQVITTQVGDLLPAPKRWIVNWVAKRVKKLVPPWQIAGSVDMRAALARGAQQSFKPVKVARADLALLQYTGGTTGVSKGAMLTHRNILANVAQTGTWISQHFVAGHEIAIAPLPMYHIFGLTSMLCFVQWGCLIVLIANPRDLPGLIKELGRRKFSVLTGVNTLFNGLLHAPGFAELDFSQLKAVIGGGAAVQESVAKRWQEVTGHFITEAYGLTEASPAVCANPLDMQWNGSVGLPLPSTEVSIRDDAFNPLTPWLGDDARDLHTGELCVRGPQVMKGYWNVPDESARVLRDGWLRTGDLGHMNADGFITITDRQKDLILVSGFNVYPNEVESVVAALPGVLECGVCGVPDERTGEAVKVSIVRRDPTLTKEDVLAHCKTLLTGYKLPRHIEFRDALPKTPVGKVLRRALRDAPPN